MPAAFATTDDLGENWRPLRGQELINGHSWLRTASAALRVQVPGIDWRVANEPAYGDLVRAVTCLAVIRVLRGADRTDPATTEAIFFTRAELDRLMRHDRIKLA